MSTLALALMGMNSIVSSINYEYDEMGRLVAEIGNNGQNIRYAYDAEDRLTQVTDSQNRVTRMEYDARGRLLKQIDAAGGTTRLAYDAGDRTTQVVDPRGLITTYAYDGFGQLWSQHSPDTGDTSHTYDQAGQRTATVRNDGSTVTYGYDGLGRMTSLTSGDQQQSFTYDWCSWGIGRLCGLAASGTSTHFAYLASGQLRIRRDWLVSNGVETDHSTSYDYDDIGRVSGITYPDGGRANYSYAPGGQLQSLAVVIDGKTHSVINGATWKATGAHRRLPYGNGLERGYNHDLDGRLTAMSVWGPHETKVSYWDYGYSPDNEITRIADAVTPSLDQDVGYDALSRLVRLDRYGVANHLSYDANGNHDRYQAGNALTRYTIDPHSNRALDYSNQDGSRQYQYDALGNRISETSGARTTTYTYNPFNRMAQSNVDGRVTDYLLNAQGQRVVKSNDAGTSRYYFAGQNQLLSELTNSTWTNYLWFGGELVGLVRNGNLINIHTDHLGRPAFATDGDQRTVWKAYNYAYGRSVTQDDIGGLNIGFPGQYYDVETGLWYNGFRDYDASIARYVQSDPIGLAGGINTYAYVMGNPVNAVDSLGLQTCLLTTVGPGGVRDHSAVFTTRGDGAGGPALYDPAGSYGAANGGGSSGIVTGDAADIGQFREFHNGQTVESTCKNTSQEEEVSIINNAVELPSAAPFQCGVMSSTALSGQPSFPHVQAGTFWPGNLLRQFRRGP